MDLKKIKRIRVPLTLTLSALIPVAVQSADDQLRNEVKAIREQLEDLKSNGGSSSRGWPSWFSLGGEWEVEYTDAESDENADSSANSHTRFQHDKFLLKPKIKFSKNMYMKGELEFGTDDANLEEFQVYFTGLPGNSWVKAGLDERFSKADGKFDMANRKTEAYPMLGSAFWRDEEFALTWGGKNKLDAGMLQDVFWRVSVGDGLELADKQVGENDTYEITHDNDAAGDAFDNKTEWGFGLGMTFKPSDNYKFDMAGWHFESELNYDEKVRLNGITGYAAKENGINPLSAEVNHPHLYGSRQQRTGFRTTHKMGNSTFTYEIAGAKDAAFRRKGWYIQGSHKFKFKPLIAGEFVKGIEPLIRFEEYRSNIDPVFAEAEAWDRKNTLYAVLIDLTSNKNLKSKLKLEYHVHDERTGALPTQVNATSGQPLPDDVDNNEFLAQLELKF